MRVGFVKSEVRVVAGLFCRGDRVLVQRRPRGKARELLWELPCGKVEPGESDEDALARECEEELNVSIEVGDEVWSTVHAYDDLTIELVVYRATMGVDLEPRPLDEQELRWVPRAELGDLRFCPADEPLVSELMTGL